MLTPKAPKWGDTVQIVVPVGNYAVTPELFPYDSWQFKARTKYWSFTREGPVMLSDPDAPGQPDLVNRAARQFLDGDCTKWWTHVQISTSGSVDRSTKTVKVQKGKTTNVTAQQFVIIGIQKWKTKDAASKAWNAWCETTSLLARNTPVGAIIKKILDKKYDI